MRQVQWLLWLVALLGSVLQGGAAAQHRDPLTDKEIDEMREAADLPDKRLQLLASFARARMTSIQQLRADSGSAKDRPVQIHDLLQDLISLLDEIDDNIDMYGSHKTDMRKGLKLIIEADSEWQLQLRRLKEQSPPEELEQYSFVLNNASEAVQDGADGARKELQEQNELARNKKLVKTYSDRPD
jgi:hypothetical protein